MLLIFYSTLFRGDIQVVYIGQCKLTGNETSGFVQAKSSQIPNSLASFKITSHNLGELP